MSVLQLKNISITIDPRQTITDRCRSRVTCETGEEEELDQGAESISHQGCISSLLNCICVSFTCVLSLHLSPAHRGCMERRKETKARREEMRKDILGEMRRPFLGGVT